MAIHPKTIFKTKTVRETLDAVATLADMRSQDFIQGQLKARTVKEGAKLAAKAEVLQHFADQLRQAEIE